MDEKISLGDFIDILGILDKRSIFFIKINQMFKEIMTEPVFSKMGFGNKLPLKMCMDMGKDFRL